MGQISKRLFPLRFMCGMVLGTYTNVKFSDAIMEQLDRRSLAQKKAAPLSGAAFHKQILTVSYSHMGRPHTTIGAERFHFRVRNGSE